jgi:hypothetical protein
MEAVSDDTRAVLRRIKWMSAGAFFLFAAIIIFTAGFHALLGLTCSAAVTMISFLWMEEIVGSLFQPSSYLHARRLTVRTFARFALLGVALWVTIIVARFNALSVLLGFSIVVVGIIGEAVYSTFKSFSSPG